MKYAIFLRGINVGGIKVPMIALKDCLTSLPVSDVQTYVQTGNITLDSPLPAVELKHILEKTLHEEFHYEAFVLIYPRDALGSTVAAYPFLDDADAHRYAVLCASQAVADELASHRAEIDTDVEDIVARDYAVYWHVPKGHSTDTVFAKLLAQPKYKGVTTVRNLNTLEKML
ncbi:MAG TPA: DUF1697 domain-containing protein [Candidatus Saccharimonadales bacterium]|nr:DUF1697 domain-containing protein [Candidatus Saccharimonadales bacterium]